MPFFKLTFNQEGKKNTQEQKQIDEIDFKSLIN